MKKMLSVLATASVLAIGSASANAATLTITGISGEWSSWTGGTGVSSSANGTTAQLRWGTPAGQSNKSGYNFTPVTVPTTQTDHTDFDLGTFTHLNYPINSGTSITQAKLDATFTFTLGSDTTVHTLTSQYVFNHWETPNTPSGRNKCANGQNNNQGVNANGCADRVTAMTNPSSTDTFNFTDEDGVEHTYVFAISGFNMGSEFWTKENDANSAILQGRFTHESYIQPAPVPLPAAAGLLVAGMGALTVAGRRRRRT